jgi:hypothetical protein
MQVDPKIMNQHMGDPSPTKGRYQKQTAVVQQENFEDEEYLGENEMTFGGSTPQPWETTDEDEGEPQARYQNPVFGEPRHGVDEEVLPGLFQSQIDSWKKQFGEVLYADVKGQGFIFRPLERYEYKAIIATPNSDPLIREEMICEYCVLYPQEYDFSQMAGQKAGYPAVLSELIMDHSGFTRDVKVSRL